MPSRPGMNFPTGRGFKVNSKDRSVQRMEKSHDQEGWTTVTWTDVILQTINVSAIRDQQDRRRQGRQSEEQ